jgi:hypothetical protein
MLGDLAFKVVAQATSNSIGLYRGSWLQIRDGFGIGRHPEGQDAFRVKDMSFWYQILLEQPA